MSSSSSVLDFAVVGDQATGEVKLDDNLSQLTNIIIPKKLPPVDNSVIDAMDPNTVAPLLESIQSLIEWVPAAPPRPMIDISISDDAAFNGTIRNMLKQIDEDIKRYNRENTLKRRLEREESMQESIDDSVKRVLREVQPAVTTTTTAAALPPPLPPPPPPPYCNPYYPPYPPYIYYPPPPPPPPPATTTPAPAPPP